MPAPLRLEEGSVFGARNSMLYWFPFVQRSGVSHPRTLIVKVEPSALWAMLDGRDGFGDASKKALVEAGRKIGYPLFLRTDQLAGKHSWVDTCYVPSEDVLFQHIYELVETHGCVIGVPDPQALVFRELLPLESSFTAFRGMPVARERRYFIKDNRVVCHHAYWIPDAVEKGWSDPPLPPDWRARLAELNEETEAEVQELTLMAEKLEIPGAWSVDFARLDDPQPLPPFWVLLDMALAAVSYHPPCPMAGGS